MEMCLFWITDQVNIGEFYVQWHPGYKNLAYYYTTFLLWKASYGSTYMVSTNPPPPPLFLLRVVALSALKGCVGSLPTRYI